MKKIKIYLLLLICIGSASCSKDSNDLGTKETHMQYLGPIVDQSTTQPSTKFLFSVTSKASSPIQLWIEAESKKQEKMKSQMHQLKPGETKEIYIQKWGVIFDRDYLKSYKVHVELTNPALVPPVFPKRQTATNGTNVRY